MTTPDPALLKASVDSALLGIGKIMNAGSATNDSLNGTLEKAREYERCIGLAHTKVVEYICQMTGQSRRER